ncbi:MAG: hypothetical protein ACI4TI_01215 [Christensenellales bacterium]
MKKFFNIVLSLLTMALCALYIYSKIQGAVPLGSFGAFMLNYGSLILLALFTFNNLLAKVTSVFFVLFLIAAIVLIILFINPSLITGIFAK